jgi:ATP-dependent 26S proteasome regulatory subunit
VVIADIPGQPETRYFQTSLDHVLAELTLTSLRLLVWVRNRRRQTESDESDKFQGLYISEKEIDEILANPGIWPTSRSLSTDGDPDGPEEEKIKQLEKIILTARKEARRRGLPLRLEVLESYYRLSRAEVETILICLLAEIDLRYQKLYAYLQDDITKKAPTVNLVLNYLGDSAPQTFQTRASFYPEAPLVKYQLIGLQDDRSSAPSTLLAKSLGLDERITSYLLGRDGCDARLRSAVTPLQPQKKLAALLLPDDIKKRLQGLIEHYRQSPLIMGLADPDEAHKMEIGEVVGGELGCPLLRVDVKALLASEIPAHSLIPLVFREGVLQNALIFLDNLDHLADDKKESAAILNNLLQELPNYPHWVILGHQQEWPTERTVQGKPWIDIRLSPATFDERLQKWQTVMQGEAAPSPDINLGEIANKFKLTGSQIALAAAAAANLAKWRDPEHGRITSLDLYTACRRQSGQTLNALAQKVHPNYAWADIILPKDQMEQLKEICRYSEYYHTVYEAWGFGRKLSLGKGLKVLFAGPSGTGKTMAAEVIAGELKIDLYKIDLSTIVSKYIGETEKNLDKIFHEGQTSNAILFFDEADALFGKRSEVRDAHDRYANIETAYLLQKMDEYEGTLILATNLRKNMDEAFARRMHFSLEFSLPEEADRQRLWRQVFPAESPLDPEIDFEFLAHQFKISGGNIKNIALGSAFLAAANGGQINMASIIKATKREFQKMGRLCTETDFGRYFEIVKN